ncbi:MAG: chemotaxis protein CheW [Vicinamibacterales bacterium]
MNVNEVVREFLVESVENLDQLDQAFVQLERDPRDAATLAAIFRTIHTVKGTSGFLGFGRLERVAHAGENLLSLLREGQLTLDVSMTSALLRVVDATRSMLAAIESTGADGTDDYAALVHELEALAIVPQAAGTPATVPAAVPVPGPEAIETIDAPVPDDTPSTVTPAEAQERRSGQDRRSGDDRRLQDERAPAVADSSLRIDVGLLDRLMNLVGELVLARNQILQFTATQSDSAFVGATQRLNLVTSELQEGVMKTRMQPIGNVWTKFPRIVRDLSVQCGRDVRIEMEGRDTELDKTIIEAIKDPLTHIVRNSVDHGIEPPEARVRAGKPAQGLLLLRAFHEGGQITIEIADDGAGIDPEKVKRKAVSKGIVSSEQAARLSDHDAIRLVFLPGFSTAETISNISGRGVGMDVVRTNIERIGGTVDIQSRPGHGTTLRIRIPLTLAIIPALIVTAGGERFAIPQAALVELVRLEGTQIDQVVERVGQASFYRLRGNLLPLVTLHRELGLDGTADGESISVAVLNADGRQFGLLVDAISDTEEIVVKPLGKQLKRVNLFAGATIMGDGRVALILDVPGLAQKARVFTDMPEGARTTGSAAASASAGVRDGRTLLLFQVGVNHRMAIPLDSVARLEEFSQRDVEHAGVRAVVQYRGDILPLVSMTSHFTGRDGDTQDPMQVIVCAHDGRQAGLVVDRILDIVHEPLAMQRLDPRSGIAGTAIVQQRVTEVVDVAAVMGLASAGCGQYAA